MCNVDQVQLCVCFNMVFLLKNYTIINSNNSFVRTCTQNNTITIIHFWDIKLASSVSFYVRQRVEVRTVKDNHMQVYKFHVL